MPAVRFLRLGLKLSPDQVSWASLGVTAVAGLVIATGHLGAGLVLMAVGQLVDAMDGAMARAYGLSSPTGKKVDTLVDRLSETTIFVAFAFAGTVSWTWARRVRVTARWGWSAVPDAVNEACILRAAALYKRKEAPFAVAGFDGFGAVRLRAQDPDVSALLGSYIRPDGIA